jgi:hypothetical protein
LPPASWINEAIDLTVVQQKAEAVNRAGLQRLAAIRVKDAEVLLSAGQWPGAYYVAGYALECALKSCILHHLEKTGIIFRDRKYLNKLGDSWTHELDTLLDLADLTSEFGAARKANSVLDGYWSTAKNWKETSRYEEKSEAEARGLLEAITNDPNGMLRWIQMHW